eukprot:scaffold38528_cov21-Tisochrysis_lutea.AAC.4
MGWGARARATRGRARWPGREALAAGRRDARQLHNARRQASPSRRRRCQRRGRAVGYRRRGQHRSLRAAPRRGAYLNELSPPRRVRHAGARGSEYHRARAHTCKLWRPPHEEAAVTVGRRPMARCPHS